MRKHYIITTPLLAVMMFFFVSVNAQKTRTTFKQQTIQNKAVSNEDTQQLLKSKVAVKSDAAAKSPNAVIWSDDFSVPSHWTIASEITTGQIDNWVIGTAGPAGTYAINDIWSTTASNGFGLFDSDLLCSGNQIADLTTATAINCTGHTYVGLQFEQYYRRFYDSTYVCVSTNGTTWTKFSVNKSLANNAFSGVNPTVTKVNISSVAANQATVYIRFQFYSPSTLNANSGCGYSWMVDDVKLYDLQQYDVALTTAANPNEYVIKPKSQYTSGNLTLSASVQNVGASACTNVKMNVKITDFGPSAGNVVYTGTSNTVASLASMATGTLTATTNYAPPVDTSIYVIEYLVTMTQTDGDKSNDTLYRGFWVENTLYSRSDELFTGQLDGALGVGTGSTAIMGNYYTLTTADKVSRIDAYVTGPAVGDTTQMYVYSTNASGPNAVVAQTATYKFTTAGGQWVSLPIQGGPFSLSAGTYFVGLKDFNTTNNIGLGYTSDNFTIGKSWLKVNTAAFDSLENYGYYGSFIVEPYIGCGGFATTASASKYSICSGSSTTLNAIDGTSYAWSPATGLSSTTVASPVASPTSPTIYTVIVTNNGCTASDTVSVNVLVPPTAEAGSNVAICKSNTANLSASGGGTYAWSSGGTVASVTVNPTSSTYYTVTVTATNGCTATDKVKVIVGQGFTTGMSIIDATACGTPTGTATVTPTGGNTPFVYSWSTTPPQTTSIASAIQEGTYYVTVTDSTGCTVKDTAIVSCPTGIADLSNSAAIKVIPNPSHGDFTLTLNGYNGKSITVSIFDVKGQMVFNRVLAVNKDIYSEKENLQALPKGLYYIHILSDGIVKTSKLVIE